jgi:hypothetical protein
MIDWFVLLTPILVLGIVALLGFMGCAQVLGINYIALSPSFDPPPGVYYSAQGVTLSADAGVAIYYTTDGSDPTSTSTKYDGTPIPITHTLTLKAIAQDDDPSGISKGKYYIGPIVHQQNPAETPTAGGTTTNPFGNPLGLGNLVVVWIFYQSDTAQISQVTDTAGNTYQSAAARTSSPTAPAFQQEIWYANNINPGIGVSVSVILQGGTAGEVQISAHEYSNAVQEATNPLADVPPPGTTGPNGASVVSNSLTTSGRLVFGAAWFRGSGTAGPGFNLRSALKNNVAEDMDVVTPGMVQAVFVNTSPTEDWIAQMITLT